MQIVRRFYLYGMSGVTLGVLLVGLNNLFVVAFHALGLGRGTFIGGDTGDREQLSLAIALTIVGLLVWTIHWLLIERSVREAAADGREERASGIRALYITVVLALLLIFGMLAGIQLLDALAQRLFGLRSQPDLGFLEIDTGAALATVLVAGAAWVYHAAIRRRDLASTPMEHAAAWIPRIYLYGAALLGLIFTALSIGSLLQLALRAVAGTQLDFGEETFTQRGAADALAGIVGWGIVFVGHWWYATSLLRGEGWRAASERRARVRLAYLVAVQVAGAIATVTFAAQSLSVVLGFTLGADRTPFSESLLQAAIGPMLGLLPWAFAWLLHWRWMRDEADAHDPGWLASASRLASAGVGLVGVGATAGGVGGLLGLLLDIVLGGNRTTDSLWRGQVADFVAVGAIGTALWLWNWANLQGRRAADPEGEARSTIRRAYLLLIVGGSLLASLAALAVLLFQVFNAILGVDPFVNRASEISASLGALITAAASAAYHGLVERRDRALRDATPAPPVSPATEAAPAAIERQLLLRAPSAAQLEAALASLRGNLPPDVVLEEPASG